MSWASRRASPGSVAAAEPLPRASRETPAALAMRAAACTEGAACCAERLLHIPVPVMILTNRGVPATDLCTQQKPSMEPNMGTTDRRLRAIAAGVIQEDGPVALLRLQHRLQHSHLLRSSCEEIEAHLWTTSYDEMV